MTEQSEQSYKMSQTYFRLFAAMDRKLIADLGSYLIQTCHRAAKAQKAQNKLLGRLLFFLCVHDFRCCV